MVCVGGVCCKYLGITNWCVIEVVIDSDSLFQIIASSSFPQRSDYVLSL
jgi:hypothetical protein